MALVQFDVEEIDALSSPQREIVYKHCVEGKSHQQIANEMHYSKSSVKRYFRAVMKELEKLTPPK